MHDNRLPTYAWHNYRSCHFQDKYYLFDVKKRNFIEVDEIGNMIQSIKLKNKGK